MIPKYYEKYYYSGVKDSVLACDYVRENNYPKTCKFSLNFLINRIC